MLFANSISVQHDTVELISALDLSTRNDLPSTQIEAIDNFPMFIVNLQC